jgi:hypothetical protein
MVSIYLLIHSLPHSDLTVQRAAISPAFAPRL